MVKQAYEWKRFYCLRTGTINLSDNGYMSDPDSEYGKYQNPDVVSFDTISNKHCLIILGQPGIGKSYELEKEYNILKNKLGYDQYSLFFNIASFTETTILYHEIFNTEVFKNWQENKCDLHLFLDSIDECKIFNRALSDTLIREIRKGPLDRLYLRITCRTAEWSLYLEEQIHNIYANSNEVDIYELTPLRKKDISLCAEKNGTDREKFLLEIENKEVVPLAIIPTTLEILINIFRQSGTFPVNKVDLYEQGCRKLCKEIGLSRLERNIQRSGLEKRLLVASRLAVVTMFSNKNKICIEDDYESETDNFDVCQLGDFYGMDSLNDVEFEVGADIVKETLETALFTSRGKNELGWVQQTFAEFLAAKYLINNQLPLKQIINLLRHPSDPERKIVPQLYQITVWLANMNVSIFKEILEIQPEVLLGCDLSLIDETTKETFVAKILNLINEHKLRYYDWSLRRGYNKFKYDGLTSYLRPILNDKSRNESLRNAVVDIIEACNITELNSELLLIALDKNEKIELRTNAAHALLLVGDKSIQQKLKPLALSQTGDDPDEELKGFGLKAVWPEHMTSQELFKVLTPPCKKSLYGSYKSFFKSVMKYLLPCDLPHALRWVIVNDEEKRECHTVEDLINEILTYSWLNLEEIIDLFIEILDIRMREHHLDLPEELFKRLEVEDAKRRFLIQKIMNCLDEEDRFVSLCYSQTPVILEKDFIWLVNEYMKEINGRAKDNLLKAAKITFNPNVREHTEYLFQILTQNEELNYLFGGYFTPVLLTDNRSVKAKQDYYLNQDKLDKRNKRPSKNSPSPAERVEKCLNEFEESLKCEAFWQLNLVMTLTDTSVRYEDELEFDLRKLPGWENSDYQIKQRITNSAKNYIKIADPHTSHWLGTNTIYRPALAGFRAILLLINTNAIQEISKKDWEKWASILLAYPTPNGNENELIHRKIIKQAYHFAPSYIRSTLDILIDQEAKNSNYIFITSKISECWDEALLNLVLKKAKNPKISPRVLGVLLDELLSHGDLNATSFAVSLLKKPSRNSISLEKRVEAASALMRYSIDVGWDALWPVLRLNTVLSNKIIEKVASYSDEDNILRNLNEDKIAKLFILLVKRYPYKTDPQYDGFHSIGYRESISNWRDSLVRYLRDKGTEGSCIALKEISTNLPEHSWLVNYYYDAQINTRMKSWNRPEPKDILKIIKNHDLRYINSGFDLINVVKESLERAEIRVQGKNPLSFLLWDELSPKVFKPKNENSFSDFIKDHLEMDLKKRGIIVNREVEFTRSIANAKGQRVDILVDALLNGKTDDHISLVIEIKGNWNRELGTSMKEQLMDRYIKQARLQHGLYVIGWFSSNCWEKNDHRRSVANKQTLLEARRLFEEQASSLSNNALNVQATVIDMSLN